MGEGHGFIYHLKHKCMDEFLMEEIILARDTMTRLKFKSSNIGKLTTQSHHYLRILKSDAQACENI
jgi:hypothetical protein